MTSLQIFLWVYIAVIGLTVAARLLLLSYADYPRRIEWTRGQDALSLVFSLCFGVWAYTLLP